MKKTSLLVVLCLSWMNGAGCTTSEKDRFSGMVESLDQSVYEVDVYTSRDTLVIRTPQTRQLVEVGDRVIPLIVSCLIDPSTNDLKFLMCFSVFNEIQESKLGQKLTLTVSGVNLLPLENFAISGDWAMDFQQLRERNDGFLKFRSDVRKHLESFQLSASEKN